MVKKPMLAISAVNNRQKYKQMNFGVSLQRAEEILQKRIRQMGEIENIKTLPTLKIFDDGYIGGFHVLIATINMGPNQLNDLTRAHLTLFHEFRHSVQPVIAMMGLKNGMNRYKKAITDSSKHSEKNMSRLIERNIYHDILGLEEKDIPLFDAIRNVNGTIHSTSKHLYDKKQPSISEIHEWAKLKLKGFQASLEEEADFSIFDKFYTKVIKEQKAINYCPSKSLANAFLKAERNYPPVENYHRSLSGFRNFKAYENSIKRLDKAHDNNLLERDANAGADRYLSFFVRKGIMGFRKLV